MRDEAVNLRLVENTSYNRAASRSLSIKERAGHSEREPLQLNGSAEFFCAIN
jgi:hypothetical protein